MSCFKSFDHTKYVLNNDILIFFICIPSGPRTFRRLIWWTICIISSSVAVRITASLSRDVIPRERNRLWRNNIMILFRSPAKFIRKYIRNNNLVLIPKSIFIHNFPYQVLSFLNGYAIWKNLIFLLSNWVRFWYEHWAQ